MILHQYVSGGNSPVHKWKFYSGNSENNNFLSAKAISHFKGGEKKIPFTFLFSLLSLMTHVMAFATYFWLLSDFSGGC